MAASINKDQIIEFISKRQDVLVLALLVILGAWGYMQMRASLGETVEDVITKNVKVSVGASQGNEDLNTNELVRELDTRRPLSVYLQGRNPFGTPAEQLKLRQEVQQLYQRGVELYKAKKYEAAIQQFRRVVRRDVTETRIQYPIPPSEYIRLADREVKLGNLDAIVANAREEIRRGDSLVDSSPDQAIQVYEPALAGLRNLLSVDPKGEVMGKKNLDEISALVANLQQTVGNLRRQRLGAHVDSAIAALQGALKKGVSDAYGLLLALSQARRVKKEIKEVDVNGTVVPSAKRTELDSLIQNGGKTLFGAVEEVARQVRARTSRLVAQSDFHGACACVKAFSDLCAQTPDNSTLTTAQIDLLATYLGGLAGTARKEITKIQEAFQKGDYSSYDSKTKEALIGHLSEALSLGPILSETDRAQLVQLEDVLRRLKPAPRLDTAYELVSWRGPAGRRYSATLRDKKSRKEVRLSLRLNRKDRSGFLLSKVDSRNRIVILSKLPEYAPSQFKMP